MAALRLVLMALFILAGTVLTGPFHLKMTGGKRFLAGFGIFAMMNIVSSFVLIAVMA